MPEPSDEDARAVDVHQEDTGVVLTVQGYLDDEAGASLVQAASEAADEHPARLDIDLCSLTGFTEGGADSLVACREVCAELPDGLHYRTGQGPGRDALLTAYSDQP